MKLERFSGDREQVGRKFAEVMVGLYRETPEDAKPSPYSGGRKAGMEALAKFSVHGYANTRNKIHGNVSRLSFYIRHGVLGLREVAESVRDRFGRSYDAIKFWQELGWRQFWRLVYARLGDQIYEDLEPPKVNLG
ncbi:MAG: DNA photolyase, partial [Verrucomicrobia bacterium]|nr:DNA photolyase [Verrucomicrobiota bacterium]